MAFVEYAVNRNIVEEIILPQLSWLVIPALQIPDGKIVYDTADIVAQVEAVIPGPSVISDGPPQQLVSLLFQLYAAEWLTPPAMYYRWNYNEEWIY